MTSILHVFDFSLVLILLWLAWSLLRSKNLFRAVVLFITFGLLMVIAWVRLEAPDIALAEAAIGTGVTGVLLLDAIGHLGEDAGYARLVTPRRVEAGRQGPLRRFFSGPLLSLLIVMAGLTMIRVVTVLPEYPRGLVSEIDASLALSGVRSRVTAVLLNFRGYDTLLEIAVMLVAVTGVLSLRGQVNARHQPVTPSDPILSAFTRLIVPVTTVVSAYLLYEGGHAAGGAFQGGSVFAGTLVLLRLSGFKPPSWLWGRTTDALVFGGFILFLLVAGGLTLAGNNLLEYPAGRAGDFIFLIEAGLTVSIAFILAEILSSWGRS